MLVGTVSVEVESRNRVHRPLLNNVATQSLLVSSVFKTRISYNTLELPRVKFTVVV